MLLTLLLSTHHMNLFNITLLIIATLTALLLIIFYINRHKKKYLIFSSVGDRNNVQTWISGPSKKNFDLIIYYYGNKEKPIFDANLLVKRKGLKFDNFHHFLAHNNTSKYDAIWVVDDDIIMDTASINRMFQIFLEYKLRLAQPSFDKDSLVPHAVTRNNPNCILRYTNFVENNVAIFSSDVIPLLKNSFKDARTGFGVDFVWPAILNYPTNEIAVIDEVSCYHPITDYSSLDEVVPRHLHKLQGAELLIKYGLLASDWQPTEHNPWPNPYVPREYSRVVKR